MSKISKLSTLKIKWKNITSIFFNSANIYILHGIQRRYSAIKNYQVFFYGEYSTIGEEITWSKHNCHLHSSPSWLSMSNPVHICATLPIQSNATLSRRTSLNARSLRLCARGRTGNRSLENLSFFSGIESTDSICSTPWNTYLHQIQKWNH